MPGDGETTLAQLLAVFWRRRLIVLGLTGLGLLAGVVYIIVTKPLYRATASVRPGITAYTEQGGPVREWKLKDITFWFEHGMYADPVREALGWPRGWPAPIIDARFIARGSQNIQGGDVVTLQTLSPEPQVAARILDLAIDAFNAFAAADSVASGLALTRAGLDIRLAGLETERVRLETKRQRIDLNIAETRQQLAGFDASRQRVELQLEEIESANRLRRSLLAEAEAQAKAAGGSRERLEASAMPAAAGTAAASALALRRFEQRNRALADSLRYEIEIAASAVIDLNLRRDVDLERERSAILTRLGDLQLQRERDYETERATLEQTARGYVAQLTALSPLERIGKTHVTIRPVRPRKLRAVALLTVAGAFASLAFALAWDYVATHRDEIRGRRDSA